MRTVAAYSLTRHAPDSPVASKVFYKYIADIEEWLRWKGANEVSIGVHEVKYSDKRIAKLSRERVETDCGILAAFVLHEPIAGGTFETHLDLAYAHDKLALSCRLGTVRNAPTLAPVSFDARCPRILRHIIGSDSWTSGTSVTSSNHLPHLGRNAGKELARFIWDTHRGLPVVAISDRYGTYLQPNLANDLAYDLAGLATVVQLDRDASWTLSQAKGRVWSCYAGAIRLYWPFRTVQNNPYTHPFWTHYELLRGDADPVAASKRIRSTIYRMILEQSAFQRVPYLISEIRDNHRLAQRSEANDTEELLALAEEEIGSLTQKLSDRDTEISNLHSFIDNQSREFSKKIDDLEAKNRELRRSQNWTQMSQGPEEEEVDRDIETLQDAVFQARDDCANLIFGDDVPDGIESLAHDAGPPEKVLDHLIVLDEMTEQLQRNGKLGMSMRDWFRTRNVDCSPEKETLSNQEMERRRWDDGSGTIRQFEFHLKPNDGTSPNRCVRIYFEFDKKLRKTVVGWVGRHPE